MPYYSFVLLCYNQWLITKQAIETLIQSLEFIYIKKGIEIIIVDNGSTDEIQMGINRLKQEKAINNIHIVSVKLNENMGYPIGINMGLSQAKGSIISVLNNDLIFTEGWFSSLVQELDADPNLGLAAPYLSYAYGIQNVNVFINGLDKIQNYSRERMLEHKDNIIYTNRVIGACMVLKREVLEVVGGNDFWFGLGHFDDDDWCLRIRISGFKIAVVGGSFVYHIGSASFNQLNEKLSHLVSINKKKFINKWGLKNYNALGIEDVIVGNQNCSKHYYIPLIYSFSMSKKKNTSSQQVLLVADWENENSKWKEKLKDLIKFNGYELIIWLPSQYFNKYTANKITYELSNKCDYKIIDENIPHVNLANFICSYNAIIKVEDDYINKYLIDLGKKMSIKII